jgi:hypothetical protein
VRRIAATLELVGGRWKYGAGVPEVDRTRFVAGDRG